MSRKSTSNQGQPGLFERVPRRSVVPLAFSRLCSYNRSLLPTRTALKILCPTSAEPSSARWFFLPSYLALCAYKRKFFDIQPPRVVHAVGRRINLPRFFFGRSAPPFGPRFYHQDLIFWTTSPTPFRDRSLGACEPQSRPAARPGILSLGWRCRGRNRPETAPECADGRVIRQSRQMEPDGFYESLNGAAYRGLNPSRILLWHRRKWRICCRTGIRRGIRRT